MSILEALLLGIVQGLTEFLPVSSSGHLIIVPWLQDYTFLQQNEDFNKTFDVAVHFGTLTAVLFYFRHDLARMIVGGLRSLRRRSVETVDERLAWVIVIGTVPAVLAGGFGEEWIDDHLGEPWLIALSLIFFGIVLYLADRRPAERKIGSLSYRDGLFIGVAQAIALSPGTSRSGVTISAARWLGLDRDAAARISFLLLVPAVFGATVLKTVGAIEDGLPPGVAWPMVVGVIASAISGYGAIAGLLAFVRSRSYDVFVAYRLIAGILILGLIATGIRSSTF